MVNRFVLNGISYHGKGQSRKSRESLNAASRYGVQPGSNRREI